MANRYFLDKDTGKVSILIDGKAMPVSPLTLYRHALERLRERYGESQANLQNIYFMEREIHERRARKVGNGYNNCSVWEVNWQGGSYFALHNDDTQTIVTFYNGPMVAQKYQFGHEEEPVTNGKSFTVGDQAGDEYLKDHGVQVAEPTTGDKADDAPHRRLERQEFIDLTKSCRTMAELAEKSGMNGQRVRYRCKSYGVYPHPRVVVPRSLTGA